MAELALAAAILWWMLCGAAVTLGIMAWRGKRLFDKHELFAPYAERLGKACFVFNPNTCETKKYRVVAVSHKGAINIRDWEDDSARAFWISKSDVSKRGVKFERGIQ